MLRNYYLIYKKYSLIFCFLYSKIKVLHFLKVFVTKRILFVVKVGTCYLTKMDLCTVLSKYTLSKYTYIGIFIILTYNDIFTKIGEMIAKYTGKGLLGTYYLYHNNNICKKQKYFLNSVKLNFNR